MADDGNYGQRFGCKHKDDSLTSNIDQVEKMYGGTPEAKTVTKRSPLRFSWKRNSMRTLSTQQTSTLKRPCLISHGETINVPFEVGEELTIMFMYKNNYAVYRKCDGVIAVLSNAEFKERPVAMLDGSRYGALLNDLEMVLMYGVAKVDHCNMEGLKLNQNDVILILAHCKGTFVAITTRKKVGLFLSEMIQPITKERLCIFTGMILKMTSVIDYYPKQCYEGLTYQITKSAKGLFSWFTINGQSVPLHVLKEKTCPASDDAVDTRHCYENLFFESNNRAASEKVQEIQGTLPQPPKDNHPPFEREYSLAEKIWFHGNVSRAEAEKLLKNEGDYLVRYKSGDPSVYILSCRTMNGHEHFKLTLNQTSHYETYGGKFTSIASLIKFHQLSSAPICRDPATIILKPVKSVSEKQKVSADCKAEEPIQLDQQESMSDGGKEKKNVYNLIAKFDTGIAGLLNNPAGTSEQSEHCTYEVIPGETSTSHEESHVYEEPIVTVPTESKSLLRQPEERRERKRARSPLGTRKEKAVVSQLCRMEREISDLKSHFQSIAMSPTDDEEENLKRRESLRKTLEPFFEMEVNDQMYFSVAEYLESDFFHEVGRRLGVHKNRRFQIEKNKEDVVERTIDLLDQWHKKEGEQATLRKLVDALEEFDPEDMDLILEDLCEEATKLNDTKQIKP